MAQVANLCYGRERPAVKSVPSGGVDGCRPLGKRHGGGVSLGIGGELGPRLRRGEEIHPRLIGDAVRPPAREALALIHDGHWVVAGEGRSVAIGRGQKRLLLFRAGEQVRAAAVPDAPLGAAFRPDALLSKCHGAVALEPQRHRAMLVGDRWSGVSERGGGRSRCGGRRGER